MSLSLLRLFPLSLHCCCFLKGVTVLGGHGRLLSSTFFLCFLPLGKPRLKYNLNLFNFSRVGALALKVDLSEGILSSCFFSSVSVEFNCVVLKRGGWPGRGFWNFNWTDTLCEKSANRFNEHFQLKRMCSKSRKKRKHGFFFKFQVPVAGNTVKSLSYSALLTLLVLGQHYCH